MSELDEKDAALLARKIFSFNERQGPRVGDFVLMPDGEYRRCTHHLGSDMQLTRMGEVDKADFYLGPSGMHYSNTLEPTVPKAALILLDETRKGSAWFFHHDIPNTGRGGSVRVHVPCRVFCYGTP